MTRQLTQRLIQYSEIARMEYESTWGYGADCEESREESRKATQAEKDKKWLFRLRDWFDSRDEGGEP